MANTKEDLRIRQTTVLAIKHKGLVAIGADGQASMGSTIVKSTVKKIRRLSNGKILIGFAGSTADAMALLERFEEKLSMHADNMYQAALSLSKEWRMDRYLRRLEALMLVANKDHILTLSGNGDVMKPDEDYAAIGSGGNFALAAAACLKKYAHHLTAEEMVKEALLTASRMCVYTNDQLTIEIVR